MGRDIRFKAKKLSDGKWIEGCLVTSSQGTFIATEEDTSVFPMTMDEIAPSTVCQFTGLKDSKGVDIFEGDIIAIASYCELDEIFSTSLEAYKERLVGIVIWDKFEYVLESTPKYTEKYRKEIWDCLNRLTDDGWNSISLVCGNKFDRKEGEK